MNNNIKKNDNKLQRRSSVADLYAPFNELRSNIDNWFYDSFKNFGAPLLQDSLWYDSASKSGNFIIPKVDIKASSHEYEITFEIPGVTEADLKLEIVDGYLTVSGEKKQEQNSQNEGYNLIERSYGSFHRSFALPDDADHSKSDAVFKDGVLTVSIARKSIDNSKVRKIEVRKG